jgi:hypothetical protein
VTELPLSIRYGLEVPPSTKVEFGEPITHRDSGADVAPGGAEALISGTPKECDPARSTCPVSIWRANLNTRKVDLLRGGPRQNYHPRYLPGGKRLLFQTTANDEGAACAHDANRCRLDLVTAPVDDSSATPTLFRRGAYGPELFGSTLAFLVRDEGSGCDRLPCFTASAYLSDLDGGNERRVVVDDATILGGFVSPDGRWLAYRRTGEFAFCEADAGHCRSILNPAMYTPLTPPSGMRLVNPLFQHAWLR